MVGDRSVARWRHIWLAALAALLIAQTLFRILFFSLAFYRSVIGASLHLLLWAAWLALVLLVAASLPVGRRGRPVAALAVALMLGAAHALATAFDLGQSVLFYFTGIGAPMSLILTDPKFGLALLNSMDISNAEALAAVSLLLALHVLLYAPIAPQLVEFARRLAAHPIAIPGARGPSVKGRWLLVSLLALTLVARIGLPERMWYLEYFHRGGIGGFVVAPPALTLGAPGPDAPLGPPQRLAGARPVILILVDAMRRDRMGVYDRALDTTPFLDGLARDGTLHAFPNAYSTCTFSFCGIMSILASRSWDNFTRRPPTILDALSHYGFRNYLILSGTHSTFGKIYELYGRGVVSRTEHPNDDAVVRRVAETEFSDPQHSFLYIHLISTHGGRPPAARFYRPARAGQSAFSNTYDARLRAADDVIRQLFDQFRAKGLLRNALIVITADHGERLGEHGYYYHGGPPDREATAIPVMIYDASRPAWPKRQLTSHIDIAPTIMDALGGAADPGWIGQALQDSQRIPAIPLGTEEMTGVVAGINGAIYRYRCLRAIGVETVARVERDRDVTVPADPALLSRLRALHRQVAGPIPPGPCRR